MAFDAGMLRAVVKEIDTLCADGKVERICQPVRDAIDITFHKGRENLHVYISASANTPRISVTREMRENPPAPPMFCMLLRKHLTGARLLRAETVGFERVCRLAFSAYDDMGFPCEKTLVFEIMGRFSNIILLEGERVLSALRIVDFTVSSKRQILPGMTYELPPPQDKINPLGLDEIAFMDKLRTAPPDLALEKFIVRTFLGISPLVAREIVFLATGSADTALSDLNGELSRMGEELYSWFSSVKLFDVTPVILYDDDGGAIDYCYKKIHHLFADPFGSRTPVGGKCKSFDSFGEMLDTFFGARERAERIKQRGSDIAHILSSVRQRLIRKIDAQTEELAESEKGEEYKKYGDLITANIYILSRGMEYFECADYYSEDCPTVRVPLNSRLTPAQNAQKMYKLYNKAKNTKKFLTEQIEQARAELAYIESVEVFFAAAQTEGDLLEIREELRLAGYGKRFAGQSVQKNKKMQITEYKTTGGYRLLCGRNNIQNEYLTFKVATKGDLWFHAHGVAGSHVILLCNGEEPSELDYTEAASLAAYYSSADRSTMTEVDYTRVKNIKKPPKSHPGYVIYHTNFSAYVMPRLPENSAQTEKEK